MTSEGSQEGEQRYYVVLSADQPDGELWEHGLIYTRTEIGTDQYEQRHERSKLLFTQLADVL